MVQWSRLAGDKGGLLSQWRYANQWIHAPGEQVTGSGQKHWLGHLPEADLTLLRNPGPKVVVPYIDRMQRAFGEPEDDLSFHFLLTNQCAWLVFQKIPRIPSPLSISAADTRLRRLLVPGIPVQEPPEGSSCVRGARPCPVRSLHSNRRRCSTYTSPRAARC